MKKLHLCLLFSLAVLTSSAQKVYFIYIQTDSDQPFFVKMNEKVNSSTATGYIILSKLVDSTYSFSIGFPQNKWPEQHFSVIVGKKDHGYLLKNFGEKGWGLFDLQTLAVQMSTTGARAVIGDKPGLQNKDVSAFTEILSKAADDPSLKERPVLLPKPEEKKIEVVAKVEEKKAAPETEIKEPVVTRPADVATIKKEEAKPEIKEAVIKKEEAIVKKDEPKAEVKEVILAKPDEVAVQPVAKAEEPKVEIKETVVTKPVEVAAQPIVKKEEPKTETKETLAIKQVELTEQPATEIKEQPVAVETVKTDLVETYKISKVKKWAESSTTEGFGLAFIDENDNGSNDTIRLVIPNPNPAVAVVKEEPVDDKKFIKTSELPVKEVVAAEEKKTVVETPTEAIKPPTEPVVERPVVAEKAIVVNKCKEVATGDDFVRLRKRMAAAATDDDMIGEAKKYYKLKCFSTWQLKNLGVLFLTDEGKYKFFDASYSYVTDMQAFSTLQAELKDEYYTGRFKAMLRN